MAGVRGRRQIVIAVEVARGYVSWAEGKRQGAVLVRLLGKVVRDIA